jgi:uncharacterized protein
MLDRNNENFDPYITAERGRSYKGTIPLCQFERLSDSIIDDQGEARYTLVFAKEDRLYTVGGRVHANLYLTCSLCLEKMVLDVDSEIKLGIVSSLLEAERLPDEYEPLLVVDNQLKIIDIVEEELLLAIPIIPRHVECDINQFVDQHPTQHRNNPFSILAELKSSGD